MEFMRYVRALVRRWPVVAGLAVAGALTGYLIGPSSAGSPAAQKNYFRATTTLIAQRPATTGDANTSQPGPSAQQTAFLVTTGDVPIRVAEKLGVQPKDFANRVQGQAYAQLDTIDITAVSATSDEAIRLADTFAAELIAKLLNDAQSASDARRDDALARLDAVNKQMSDLDAKIASNPPDLDRVKAERDSLTNQYRVAYDRYQAVVVAAGEPSAGYAILQSASAERITSAEYDARVKEAQDGPKQQTTAANANDKAFVAPSAGVGPVTRAGIGGILGLVLGIGLVLLLDHFDTRLRTKDEVERAFGCPVIAEVPPLNRDQRGHTEVLAYSAPRSRVAETYRVLRTALFFVAGGGSPTEAAKGGATNGNGNGHTNGKANGNGHANGSKHDTPLHAEDTPKDPKKAKVVLVTSPGPSEGKTTTVANLAAMLAEAGETVLVLNCDYRRPRLHRYLEAATPEGATSETTGAKMDTDIGEIRLVSTIVPGVKMVTGIGEGDHQANPAEIAAYQRRVVNLALDRFDYILLDTAPLLTTNDASELIPDADLLIMVCRSGATTRQAAERSSELLLRLDAPLLGVVFTGSVDAPSAQYYYYYLDKSGSSTKSRLPSIDRTKAPAARS